MTKLSTDEALANVVRGLPGFADDVQERSLASAGLATERWDWRDVERLVLTGCGDSHLVGVGCAVGIERLTGIPTVALPAMAASRFAGVGDHPERTVVIGVSASGGVVRTAEALHVMRRRGARTIALTKEPQSMVGRAAELVLPLPTDSRSPVNEDEVPGVRSFLANGLVLLRLGLAVAAQRGRTAEREDASAHLDALPQLLAQAIAGLDMDVVREAARGCPAHAPLLVLGSGPLAGAAGFVAAKLLEAAGDVALWCDLEEWAHLYYYLRNPEALVLVLSDGERDAPRAREIVDAALQTGFRTLLQAPSRLDERVAYLPVPRGPWSPAGFLHAVLGGSLLAAERAKLVGEPYYRGAARSLDVSRIRSSAWLEAPEPTEP